MDFLQTDYQNWQISKTADDIIRLKLDVANKSVNILTKEVLHKFAAIAGALAENAEKLTGVMLICGKKNGFIYGADIHEFEDFHAPEELRVHLESVHESFTKIENLPCPTACGINGLTLGGGLEIALAFDNLIATTTTQLAFPEVKLGLLPGYGGTVRALQKIGAFESLRMMLTGRMVAANEALKIGLVNQLVADEDSLEVALTQNILAGKNKTSAPKDENLQAIIDDARTVIESKYKRNHHPAPFKILDHYQNFASDIDALTSSEKTLFTDMLFSENSRNKRRVYYLTDRVKKQTKQQSHISHVHVVGAGVMGGDIAAVAALAGFQVSLQDLSQDAIDGALARAETLFARKLDGDKLAHAKARLTSDKDGTQIAKADLIIEAVAENLAIKQKVFENLATQAKPSAILATNSSAIQLEEIGANLPNPEALIGLHFFNPVPALPLVEVIWGAQSGEDVINRALGFVGQLKKLPILCKSAPGFIVNRALFPYIFVAFERYFDGEDADKIDQALLGFGMPMGPIELADQIGLDVCLDIGTSLGIPERTQKFLQEKCASGNLGRKSGAGFYEWCDKKAIRARGDYDARELQKLAKELLQPLVAESMKIVAEGVVSDADMLDAAMIFGIGFPEHTGGPLNY